MRASLVKVRLAVPTSYNFIKETNYYFVKDFYPFQTSRKALYTPWHGFYTNCPTLEPELDPMGYGERYFLASCFEKYVNRFARNKCGCRTVTDTSKYTLLKKKE